MDAVLPYEITGWLPVELFADLGADVDAPVAADAEAFCFREFMMDQSAW
jgi:hypothetical protein